MRKATSSGKRASWPLKGQSPEWQSRAAASEMGFWQNQTPTPFQPQSQPLQLWQPQRQRTWLPCNSLEMALVWKLQLGCEWGGQGCGAAGCRSSHLSVSLVVSAPLQTVVGSAVDRLSWSRGRWRWTRHKGRFPGAAGLRQESCSPRREDRGTEAVSRSCNYSSMLRPMRASN